jgi:hypothetical protein
MKYKKYLLEAAGEASTTTRLQECLHCLFFAARQKKTKITADVLNDPSFLESAYNAYCSIDTPFGDLVKFAQSKPDWVDSVVKSTTVLFDSKWLKGKYVFHRGDAFMRSIYQQYKRLAKQEGIKMGDDKWNPGDVWASKGSVKIPDFDSLGDYNKFIADSLHGGKLIGISLKKIAKSGKGKVILEGDPSAIPEKVKFVGVKKPRKVFPTGIMLMVDSKRGINLRSFRISHQADITGEITVAGGGARHGKVPSNYLNKVISDYSIPQISKGKISKMSDEDLINKVIELWMQNGYFFSDDQVNAGWAKRENDIQDRTGYWQSIIHALEFGAFLTSHKSVANKIVNYMWKGAKSESENSSQFIKVY